MARTAITPVQLTRNGIVDVTAGYAAIDVANGMKVPYAEGGSLILVIDAGNADKSITIKASTADMAVKKGQGDLVLSIAKNKEQMIDNLDQWRFKQADGYLYLDFATGTLGNIAAVIKA